ncbi:MAG: hypothetical protein ACRD2L_00545, partial [Terriglobia bacterium]
MTIVPTESINLEGTALRAGAVARLLRRARQDNPDSKTLERPTRPPPSCQALLTFVGQEGQAQRTPAKMLEHSTLNCHFKLSKFAGWEGGQSAA